MSDNSSSNKIKLKYVSFINTETLTEETPPTFELQYIDIGNVDSLGNINEVKDYIFENAPSRARRIVRHGDIIISTVRTYLQAIATIEKPPKNLIVSTGFAVVRPNVTMLGQGFGKYTLRSPKFLAEVEMRSVGVSYPAINASDLGNILIYLPSLNKQHTIADFLDCETARLDKLIAIKKRLLVLLAEKRRALIAQAVTRGLNADVPMRDSGIECLGKISVNWDIRRAKLLFQESNNLTETGMETLLSLRMERGLIPHNDVSEKEIPSNELIGYKIVEPNQVVINRMRASIGLIALVPRYGLVSPDYAVFNVLKGANPEYFTLLFQTSLLQTIFRSESKGLGTGSSGFLRLYSEDFLSIKLPLPPLEEQKAIVAYIKTETKKLDLLKAATERTISLLKERRASLIAAAVTGQIAVGEQV